MDPGVPPSLKLRKDAVARMTNTMCRFLIAKSEEPFTPQELLEKFADMSKKSHALDGDWQGDGWGVSYKNVKNDWVLYHSLLPVWEDTAMFSRLPSTTHLVIHARSASFPTQKGVLSYNQPYIEKNILFVFNGLLKGVSFPTPVPGAIGAQKIWNLLKDYITTRSPKKALEETIKELKRHTKHIQALNIGISDGDQFWVYNEYADFPEYYSLHLSINKKFSFIASEPLEGYTFDTSPVQKIVTL